MCDASIDAPMSWFPLAPIRARDTPQGPMGPRRTTQMAKKKATRKKATKKKAAKKKVTKK